MFIEHFASKVLLISLEYSVITPDQIESVWVLSKRTYSLPNHACRTRNLAIAIVTWNDAAFLYFAASMQSLLSVSSKEL